jgi:hypothetical protein
MRGGGALSKDRLLALYDGDVVGPNVGAPPLVGAAGGGMPESVARRLRVRGYYPGGYGTPQEIMAAVDEAGPAGQVGGRRRKSRRRKSRKGSRTMTKSRRQQRGR